MNRTRHHILPSQWENHRALSLFILRNDALKVLSADAFVMRQKHLSPFFTPIRLACYPNYGRELSQHESCLFLLSGVVGRKNQICFHNSVTLYKRQGYSYRTSLTECSIFLPLYIVCCALEGAFMYFSFVTKCIGEHSLRISFTLFSVNCVKSRGSAWMLRELSRDSIIDGGGRGTENPESKKLSALSCIA